MRKLTAYLIISLDGVVEAPERFVRDDLYPDFTALIAETIAEQDAVLLGRKTYEDWSKFWPGSAIEPFAGFINQVPKYVVSTTLKAVDWRPSTVLAEGVLDEIATLKRQTGGAIGVHGSIGLVQTLMSEGLLDELRLVQCPVVAGQGRRLLPRQGEPIQLDLQSARTTARGLQFLTFRPRA
jgi:dihydrofolate reductase